VENLVTLPVQLGVVGHWAPKPPWEQGARESICGQFLGGGHPRLCSAQAHSSRAPDLRLHMRVGGRRSERTEHTVSNCSIRRLADLLRRCHIAVAQPPFWPATCVAGYRPVSERVCRGAAKVPGPRSLLPGSDWAVHGRR